MGRIRQMHVAHSTGIIPSPSPPQSFARDSRSSKSFGGRSGSAWGSRKKEITQKLDLGLTALGLHTNRNLGLLLHLLGLPVPDGALAGLDGVLIGLRTRELMQQLLEARCAKLACSHGD